MNLKNRLNLSIAKVKTNQQEEKKHYKNFLHHVELDCDGHPFTKSSTSHFFNE